MKTVLARRESDRIRSLAAYRFEASHIATLRRVCARAGIREVCFLVYGRTRNVKRLVRVRNRAKDAVLHHVFGSADFDRVKKRMSASGLRFLGYLHNHVVSRAVPSEGDINGYRRRAVIFIFSAYYDELRCFRIVKRDVPFVELPVVIETGARGHQKRRALLR